MLSFAACMGNKTQLAYFTSSADAIIAKHLLPIFIDKSRISTPTDEVPYQIMPTKHSGQQSISVRSDQKIFATAGWDGRVRIYSTKTMKEVACLKWHKEGVYATAFAGILDSMMPSEVQKSVQVGLLDQGS